MKRFFIWITAVVMALSCVTVAFAAGYSKLDNLTPGQVGYVLGQLLTEKTGNYVYDVPWYADSYDYRVIVSYDSLSELCSTANGLGMTCSVRWNHNAKLYVISVDDYTPFELSSTHGVIGNPDGYIYAAYDESEQGIWNNYGIGQWGVYADYSSTSVFREVSYATLSELCANLNEKGIPCYIASTSAWGSSTYWYIRGSGTVVYQQRYDSPSISYSIANHVYLDIASAPLVARYNPESILSSCFSRLTSIQTNVTTIKNNLVNTIGSNLDSLLTTCNTISTKLDTLTSVISNGKVLVDNSDVVSAIQSIPAFDDTEITGYVGNITEWLNLFSRKYDGNYTNMLKQVTFLNESLDLLRKHVITGNRHTSEIIDMLTAAVDADTGKLLVADTAVTSAIADLTDSLSVPTGKCAHDWQLTSTGQPGTPAVTNVRLPAEYQEVEYLENTSEGAYINTGAVPSLSGTKFHIKYQMLSGSYLFGCGRNPRLACVMRPYSIQFYIGSDGAPSIVNYTLAGIFSKVVAFSGYLTGSETGRYLDITVDGTTSRFIPPDGAISGSFSDSLPFYLFAWQYGDTLRTGRGRIWGFSMEVGGNLVRDMVPCYRKADNVPGFYDLVSGSFSTNAGTGSFVTGADVPVTIITPEVPTTYDTYTCSICGEKYVDYDSTGAPEVTGVTIPFTRWFHGKFQEYEASMLSAIDAIPAYDDAAVIAAIQSIPAPTDYTFQLTAVVEKLDALANKPAVDLTTIESTLSTISDKLDNTASDVNNTIINITNDNDYFSVFYITDGDGNTRSVTDFAGALTGASGKLLSLLYRLVFADALGSVDGDLGNMEDFFTSEEPPPATAAMNGDTAPANEVIDVWAS